MTSTSCARASSSRAISSGSTSSWPWIVNLAVLHRRAPEPARERVRLFLEFAPEGELEEVPDPYYGGPNGFEEVLDLVEGAARGLLSYLRQRARAA